jgi:hypothetical protein
VLADLDRDGDQEIITSTTDGFIQAWLYDGTPAPGFPVATEHLPQYAPSVADLDGDGDLEIVQTTRGPDNYLGQLIVLDHLGRDVPGFPVNINDHFLQGCPLLVDLDDDGNLEIVVAERAEPIGYLHVFEVDGSEWGGNWPLALDSVPASSPSTADVDGDGEMEIAFLSYNSCYLIDSDGVVMPGFPLQIANARFSYGSVGFGDLDLDGDLELCFASHWDAPGYHAYHHDGSLVAGWPFDLEVWSYCPPVVTDIDADGELDILGGQHGWLTGPAKTMGALNRHGQLKPGWPYVFSDGVLGGGAGGAIVTADLDGDGQLEIFADHNVAYDYKGFVFGVDAQGNDLPGFPLRPNGFSAMNGPTIGDVDGDGDYELAVISFIFERAWINLYDLGGAHSPGSMAWPVYLQNERRTGLTGGGDKLVVSGSADLGGSAQLTVLGEPGSLATLELATVTDRIPTPYGWRLISSPSRRILASGAPLPASGELGVTLHWPPNPALAGLTLFFQGLVQDGGSGSYTNLTALTLR